MSIISEVTRVRSQGGDCSLSAMRSVEQGGFDGSGRRSCKCIYVDFYKEARPPC